MPGELLIHYGNPGAGKTLFAMKEIVLPAVREHRPFFTNITGISVSALSYLAGVHQAFIKYYPVENISDVIRYFDDEKISHDGVFVLDEMKDFIDDDKAVSWLESRINVMRKHSVDFVFIAQQCKKEYIHPNLVGATPGKGQQNNSGSDKRELFTLKQSLEIAYHDLMKQPLETVAAFNQ